MLKGYVFTLFFNARPPLTTLSTKEVILLIKKKASDLKTESFEGKATKPLAQKSSETKNALKGDRLINR